MSSFVGGSGSTLSTCSRGQYVIPASGTEASNLLRSPRGHRFRFDRGTTWSQSLERGLAILSAFGSDRSTIGVSELSRELGLSRSTTHRYIATLTSLGYLQQDAESKRYRLGPRVLDLGFAAINSMDIREISVPHLQALSDATGFTVNLAILDGPDVVYIERCRTSRSGQRQIDLNLHVGSRLPAYCTASARRCSRSSPRSGSRRSSTRPTSSRGARTRSPVGSRCAPRWSASGRWAWR